jgi:AraC-like DNA-binding protein
VDDFASAALVSMVRRSLAARGIPTDPVIVGERSGRLPLDAKRAFVLDVARRHGLGSLLTAGAAILAGPADPMRTALSRAEGPADLLARWSRLERFAHSRHRVVTREIGDRHAVLEHKGAGAERPLAAESALILGVLAALFGLIGIAALRVRAGEDADAPCVLDNGVCREAAPSDVMAVWRFEWDAFNRKHEERVDLNDSLEGEVRRLVASDPSRGWTSDALAARMSVSRRTLQRRLSAGSGLARLIGEVRAVAAAQMLTEGAASLAEIGFACGYADQPHFTREFVRRTSMTPGRYRTAFGQTVADTIGRARAQAAAT